MEENNNLKKIIILCIIILLCVVGTVFAVTKSIKKSQKHTAENKRETIINNDDEEVDEKEEDEEETLTTEDEEETLVDYSGISTPIEQPEESKPTSTSGFNTSIIKKVNYYAGTNNYLLSPYNIEIALNMLRDGADGNTKTEIDNLIGSRTINDISVKNKISIANGVFIKDIYKNNVKDNYYNILKTKYDSDIIYDKFTTPDKINSWVKDKTNNMIDKVVDDLDDDFVMGLASALAIDVKWYNEFECNRTLSEKFTKSNGKTIDVEMMHNSYDHEKVKYIETDDAKGIVLPYQKYNNVELEFIGLLPNKDINTYVNSLTNEQLTNIVNSEVSAGEKLHINLSLPRFTYDYNVEKFKEVLKDLGIKDAFNKDSANFKKMIELKYNVYVETAVHKTHIEVSETGTKAAAVTYFGMDKNSTFPMEKPKIVNIKFDKPFVYMIREKNTGELLFFGAVYEPNIWKGSTCSK